MFLVFYDSENEKERVSKFREACDVLQMVSPNVTIHAIRQVEMNGPVKDWEVVFEKGRLGIKPIPEQVDPHLKQLNDIARALEEFKWETANATAADVYRFIEEKTGWHPSDII